MHSNRSFAATSLVVALVLLVGMLAASTGRLEVIGMETATMAPTPMSTCPPDCDALLAQVKQSGSLQVIVRLNVPFQSDLTDQVAIAAQRKAIQEAQDNLIRDLAAAVGQSPLVDLSYDATPYLVLSVDSASLDYLINSPSVYAIEEDTPNSSMFDLELGKIQAETDRLAAAQTTVAPLDKCLVAGCADLITEARQQRQIRIIIGVNGKWQVEGSLSPADQQAQRAQLRLAEAMLLKRLEPFNIKLLATWASIPYMSLSADSEALEYMVASPSVINIRKEGVIPLK